MALLRFNLAASLTMALLTWMDDIKAFRSHSPHARVLSPDSETYIRDERPDITRGMIH